MKKRTFALSAWSFVLPAIALDLAWCSAIQPLFAQSARGPASNPSIPHPPMPPDETSAAPAKIFDGQTLNGQTLNGQTFDRKIVQSADQPALSSASTTYPLPDQWKARDFLNQNVRGQGVLDVSAGTIRVRQSRRERA